MGKIWKGFSEDVSALGIWVVVFWRRNWNENIGKDQTYFTLVRLKKKEITYYHNEQSEDKDQLNVAWFIALPLSFSFADAKKKV